MSDWESVKARLSGLQSLLDRMRVERTEVDIMGDHEQYAADIRAALVEIERLVRENQEWQDRCLAMQTERDEWRETARSEMAGRRAAEAEVARLRGLTKRLALGLIDANRLDYPWKAGSRASKALDEAAVALRGGGK